MEGYRIYVTVTAIVHPGEFGGHVCPSDGLAYVSQAHGIAPFVGRSGGQAAMGTMQAKWSQSSQRSLVADRGESRPTIKSAGQWRLVGVGNHAAVKK